MLYAAVSCPGRHAIIRARDRHHTTEPRKASMKRPRLVGTRVLACIVLLILALAPAGEAGLTDRIKKKIDDKAGKKAEDAIDKATQKPAEMPAEKAAETGTGAEKEGTADAAKSGGAAGTSGGKVSAVSTRFDFVPGDSVMFVDDFTLDELGEFPARWRLVQGTFEVAEMDGGRWLRCVGADGRLRMKLPAMASFPEFWTLEFDFFGEEPMGSALTVVAMGAREATAWEAIFPQGTDLAFRSGEIFSRAPLEGATTPAGRHHVMFMARGTALKAYIDRQRLANVPDISVPAGMPNAFEIRLWAPTKPMIANVRFAEGCRPAKDMLAAGKLVTYGIRFESGSDVVLPESAPILRQISTYLEANPAVRLKITGHTDNVGAPASNLDLSKRRAASVAKLLAEQFAIAADRFTTDGKGDSQGVASNARPEGRAMNRRVEFAKL